MADLSDAERSWLKSVAKFPSTFTLQRARGGVQTFEILERGEDGHVSTVARRHGYKGFVLKARDPDTGLEYAAKFCVASDYVHRTEREEAQLSSKLQRAEGLFVLPTSVGRVMRFDGMPTSQDPDFVCFLTTWVEGQTLEQFLADPKNSLTPEFVCTVANEILRGVHFLAAQGLKHDDLHAGNVMISEVDPDLALTEAERRRQRVSIIDMGSLKPLLQPTQKSRDDELSVIGILVQMYNGLWSQRRTAAAHQRFLEGFRQLVINLADDDPTRFYPGVQFLAAEIAELQRSLNAPPQPGPRAFHPFEAISAEHLADDSTLLELFVSSLPWMATLQENKPIVFTGPRGCGKSMLFRFLAARTHIGVPRRAADLPKSFGVYISCASQLQNNLSWIARKSGRAAEYSQAIATYFQLVVVRELLRAVGAAFQDESWRVRFGITESGMDRVLNKLTVYFKEPVETPRLKSQLRVLHFADDLDRLRVRVHMQLLNGEQPEVILPDTFLGDATESLTAQIPQFRTFPIIFLLDDYTASRVQPEIQRTINRIIFERRSSHYFKISSERYGFNADDIDGSSIDLTREYDVVDAGRFACDGTVTEHQARTFLAALIDARLRKANWAGRTETLIGPSGEYASDPKLAAFIRTKGVGRYSFYYGIEHLTRLWSGDTATVLQIVKEMFTIGNVGPEQTERIGDQSQHIAITNVSKAFRERVHSFHPVGPLMSKILDEYAGAARDILVDGSLDNSGAPRRLYRLEMTKPESKPTVDLLKALNPAASELARELLRRSVFVELQDSRGKEGPSTHTMRWDLRRIYLPAFGLSLARESYYDVKGVEKLLQLLTESVKFGQEMRQQYAVGKKQDHRSGNLFGDSHE